MDTKVDEESEELGFSYLSLLFNEGADSLRNELQSKLDTCKEYEGMSLDQVINDKEFKLKGLSKGVLFDEMRDLLFDEANKPLSMSMFDITLTYVLIRNLVPPELYGNPDNYEWRQGPEDHEIDKFHDIKRIKGFRNKAGHAAKIAISEKEFKTKWKILADTILRLGGQKYVELIGKRKHTPVTEDMKRSIKEKIEVVAKRQAAEIMENISNTLDIAADNIKIALSDLTGTVKIELKLPQQDIKRSIDELQTGVVEKVKDKKSTLNTEIQTFSEDVRSDIVEKSGLVSEETTIATSELLDTISTSTEELKGHVQTAERELVDSISKAEAKLSDQIQNVTETIADEIETNTTEINEKTVLVSSEIKEHIQETCKSLNEEIESGTKNVIDNIRQETIKTNDTIETGRGELKDGLQLLHEEFGAMGTRYQELVQHTVDAMKGLTKSLTKDDQLLLDTCKIVLKSCLQELSGSMNVTWNKFFLSNRRFEDEEIFVPSEPTEFITDFNCRRELECDSNDYADEEGSVVHLDVQRRVQEPEKRPDILISKSLPDTILVNHKESQVKTRESIDSEGLSSQESKSMSIAEYKDAAYDSNSLEPDDEIVQEVAEVYDKQFDRVEAEVVNLIDRADEDVTDAAAFIEVHREEASDCPENNLDFHGLCTQTHCKCTSSYEVKRQGLHA